MLASAGGRPCCTSSNTARRNAASWRARRASSMSACVEKNRCGSCRPPRSAVSGSLYDAVIESSGCVQYTSKRVCATSKRATGRTTAGHVERSRCHRRNGQRNDGTIHRRSGVSMPVMCRTIVHSVSRDRQYTAMHSGQRAAARNTAGGTCVARAAIACSYSRSSAKRTWYGGTPRRAPRIHRADATA